VLFNAFAKGIAFTTSPNALCLFRSTLSPFEMIKSFFSHSSTAILPFARPDRQVHRFALRRAGFYMPVVLEFS
jgi:hypothetical protein